MCWVVGTATDPHFRRSMLTRQNPIGLDPEGQSARALHFLLARKYYVGILFYRITPEMTFSAMQGPMRYSAVQ